MKLTTADESKYHSFFLNKSYHSYNHFILTYIRKWEIKALYKIKHVNLLIYSILALVL